MKKNNDNLMEHYHLATLENMKHIISILNEKYYETIDQYIETEILDGIRSDVDKMQRYFEGIISENKSKVEEQEVEQYNRNREAKDHIVRDENGNWIRPDGTFLPHKQQEEINELLEWKTKDGETLDQESQDALNEAASTYVNEDGVTLDEAIKQKYEKDQEQEEPEWFYITDIDTFQVHDNEIYLGVSRYEHNKKLDKYEKKDFTLVFESYTFLNCGIADTKYIKKQFINYVRNI
jgi:hypothetical protein